jgi:tripartite-type tricarboxylate transporter receptor subunit TctC
MRRSQLERSFALFCFATICLVALPVSAQEKFPTRPIELIVPGPTGGGTDLLSRLIAEEIEPILGQKMVVVNRPGAAATLGVAYVVQARPDGYTLASVWNSPITVVPQSLKVSYTTDSYTPIAMLTLGPEAFCARAEFPANNGKEMIEHLKANPDKYTYGTDGVGGKMQLASERVFQRFGVKVRPVPFSGGGETMKNVLGNHVDFYTGSLTVALPHIKAGKIKCLMLFSAANSPIVPSATGLADLGVPEEETLQWRGILGPKGLPENRLNILTNAFRDVMTRPRVREFVGKSGEEVVFRGPKDFGDVIRKEFASLADVVRKLNLPKPQ